MESKTYDAVIYLFKNDLRIDDNEALTIANKSKHVLPLYCFDPRHYSKTKFFSFPKLNGHRLKFVLECLNDVRKQFQALGSDLVVRSGKPEEVIPDLIKTLNLGPEVAVVLEKEALGDDAEIEKAIEKLSGITVLPVWGKMLYHVDDLSFEPKKMPDIFKEFHKALENTCKVRRCVERVSDMKPLPERTDPGTFPTFESFGIPVPEQDDRSKFKFVGGEMVALDHLQKFLWGTKGDKTTMDVTGTRLSPWFSMGCISPRKVYWAVKTYEKEQQSNPSTEKMMNELVWRDYFQCMALKHKEKLFSPDGTKGEKVSWKHNMEHFNVWKDGKTGVPYIDANMRELTATGFMSNKGRENVASFLTKDLELDWRLGAEWFESTLIDHEVCNNYGNWLCISGVGLDPDLGHKYNVVEEGQHHDCNGDYIRLWVPELDGIKSSKIHKVWMLEAADLKSGKVELGKTYPTPITEAPEWGK
ncbi:cryptochrome dash-like [Plakobranchus ocellatus]|uniref:Cryptochrome DASH n=1 Tax=Plakobranchus ocellatus TaxID=259542 RepID=A0AAV4DAR9_9GAST|nr:cryptochrome dash-like [Plakobranchus ocellatus]